MIVHDPYYKIGCGFYGICFFPPVRIGIEDIRAIKISDQAVETVRFPLRR